MNDALSSSVGDLRRALLKHGPASLSDAQLLEVLLGPDRSGKINNQAATKLLESFGPVRLLLDVDPSSIVAAEGMGLTNSALVASCKELARRATIGRLEDGDFEQNPTIAHGFFKQLLRPRQTEVFAAIFLDAENRMLSYEELFTGTLNACSVYVREIARRAVVSNAANVIVAHNHPSGYAEPSFEDYAITQQIEDALTVVGVRLLDHVVVGEGAPVSMAQRGGLFGGAFSES